MTVEFMVEAEQELVDAVLWYESKQPGLGRRFRKEVEDVVHSIAQNPLLNRERDGGYRRVNCPVFPYYLPYFIRHDKIIVAAVAHESQTRLLEPAAKQSSRLNPGVILKVGKRKFARIVC